MYKQQLENYVVSEMQFMYQAGLMFTVYDITRILQSRIKTPISHDDVRTYVEANYTKLHFVRDIGYHLPFSPPPQVYHLKGHDIIKYNPDILDPNVTKKSPSSKVEYLYALVDNKTGERVSPSKGNSVGLYKTRNGPHQLMNLKANQNVVKYKVTLEEVQ